MQLPKGVFEELVASARDPLLDARKHPRCSIRATACPSVPGEGAAMNVAIHDLCPEERRLKRSPFAFYRLRPRR